jgi:C4-type Zn-finger protein
MDNENICPECGAELKFKEVYYGADADGNRGEWISIGCCTECGYEEDY